MYVKLYLEGQLLVVQTSIPNILSETLVSEISFVNIFC